MSFIGENEIRKKERNAISKCCLNFEKFRKFNVILQNKLILSIESSILDSAVDKAKTRNIPIYWESENFIEQYSNIGYHIKINIDIESEVNKNKNNEIKYYLITNLCNFINTNYLIEQYNKYKKEMKNQTTLHLFDFSLDIFNKIINYIPTINAKNIGYMNSLELNPYINQLYIDELELRTNQSVIVKYSKMYTCAQCGNKKTQMREIQTRSGDEGGTLFINCIICNHTWRQY